MNESFPSQPEKEQNPERVLSREEIRFKLKNFCENFKLERELSDADGIYLFEVLDPKKGKRYTYQRKGSFEGKGQKIESTTTTIRSEDLDDGYSRTIADYDPATGEWVNQ